MKKSVVLLSVLCMFFSFSTASFAAAGQDRLNSGEWMTKYDYLVSKNGRFGLFIAFGNLILHDGATNTILWQTYTEGANTSGLAMMPDGNVLLLWYDSFLWQTNTSGHPGSYIVIQDDGNLVVYSPEQIPLWNSGTWGH